MSVLERKNTGEKMIMKSRDYCKSLSPGLFGQRIMPANMAYQKTIYNWVKEFTPFGLEEEPMTPKELAAIQAR